MFKTRLLSGIVLVLVALLTICSGGTVLYMTVLCLSLIGAGELFRVMKVREDKWNLLEITGYAGFGGFCKCFISGKKSDRLEILFRFHNAHADTEL